ncbi:MAG: hypothetical protein KF861_24690, partial [Planctomycetaceae bacterium]|nr:hypothetical protein [Planctomycetaceae bacterium]
MDRYRMGCTFQRNWSSCEQLILVRTTMKRLIGIISALCCQAALAVEYPVVYVAVPRDPEVKPRLQDVDLITGMDVGSHLRILHPDGSDEPLFTPPNKNGGVMDPCVSLDGRRVYFAYSPVVQEVKFAFEAAINLYAIDVETRTLEQLTFSTVPGDYNTGPCEVPGGRLIFTSSRNRLNPANQTDSRHVKLGDQHPVMQLFALQLHDPANTVEQVGFLNLRGALHPTLLMDGRIMWSTHENHGLRRKDLWALWSSSPDGRQWEPLWSGFGGVSTELSTLHFQSQASNGRIQLAYYYPTKSSGHGNLLDFLP